MSYYNYKKEPNLKIRAVKERSRIIFYKEDGTRAEFDLGTKEFFKTTKTKKELYKVRTIQPFFTHYSFKEVVDSFEDETYKIFIQTIQKFECQCKNVGTLLLRIGNYAHLEQYCAVGIDTTKLCGYRAHRGDLIKKPLSFYNKKVRKWLINGDLKIGSKTERDFMTHGDKIIPVIEYVLLPENHRFKELVFGYYGLDPVLLQLIFEYGYNYKRLFEYLEEIEMYENFAMNRAKSHLRDYARMATAVNQGGKIEKYPRYLKTIHDITLRNFKIIEEEFNEKKFKEVVSKYEHYTYKDLDFCVVIPETTEDLKTEGAKLHHCVASYIKDMVDEKTIILFVRKNKFETESYVTIEVRNETITQARGNHNRAVTPEEKAFLKKFAKAKKIQY